MAQAGAFAALDDREHLARTPHGASLQSLELNPLFVDDELFDALADRCQVLRAIAGLDLRRREPRRWLGPAGVEGRLAAPLLRRPKHRGAVTVDEARREILARFGDRAFDAFIPSTDPKDPPGTGKGDGRITDDRRIREALPTVRHLRGGGKLAPGRDLAGVIPGRLLLLVGMLVLLVHNDQAQRIDRGEDGRARADDDPGAALADLVPLVVPFARGQMAVQHRHQRLESARAEPGLEPLDRLRREGDLRHKYQCLLPLRQVVAVRP